MNDPLTLGVLAASVLASRVSTGSTAVCDVPMAVVRPSQASECPEWIQRATHVAQSEFKMAVREEAWSKRQQKRFRELARLEALGQADKDELRELEELNATRRRLHHPRTGEEVVAEIQREKALQGLKEALARYCVFHGR